LEGEAVNHHHRFAPFGLRSHRPLPLPVAAGAASDVTFYPGQMGDAPSESAFTHVSIVERPIP
jgi:hypothetical protein